MDWVVFVVAAIAAIGSALGVVLARNAVHAALSLVLTLFSVAVFFVLQEAHFLAAVQVIVYAGAIVVLFLFVIMLIGVDRDEDIAEPLRFQRAMALIGGGALLVMFGILLRDDWATGQRSARGPATGVDPAVTGPNGNVERIGRSLLSDYVWAFELVGLLLVVAVIGAAVMVRRRAPVGAPGGATAGPASEVSDDTAGVGS